MCIPFNGAEIVRSTENLHSFKWKRDRNSCSFPASALLAVPRHYPALKTLEHLEHTYLPQVSHYRFCKVMVDNIPKLREEIKEVSMSDLKDFLESIRKHSDKIGETAMKQVRACSVWGRRMVLHSHIKLSSVFSTLSH